MMQAQRLRRLALHVLLAWLLALGAGVVNACVVQSALHDPGQSVSHALDAAQALDLADVQDHESHHGKPPCERCCEEPSALPQAAKLPVEPLSGFWFASAPVSTLTFQTEASGTLDSNPARWRATIPISIAFLRLTL